MGIHDVEQYQWKPGQSGNPNGRPKKIYTIIKEKGFSDDDIRAAFRELMFYTKEDLKKVYDDETKPIIVRIISNQLFLALKKGDWGKIKEIVERVLGKEVAVKHSGEIDTGGGIGMYEYFLLNQNGERKEFEPNE